MYITQNDALSNQKEMGRINIPVKLLLGNEDRKLEIYIYKSATGKHLNSELFIQ
jgi:hypothetical protein